MTKTYKVIAGAFPYVTRNKIYDHGDFISEDDLNEGDGDKAVEDGFLREVSPNEQSKSSAKKK